MKKFTVKDFITYNGPCFSCQSKIIFQIGVFNTKARQSATSVFLNPVVTNEFVNIDLKINYRDSLSLKVFTKTNKFTTSSMKALTKYLDEHGLFLRSKCDNCHTDVDSEALEFNLLKEFIAPVAIGDERLVVTHDKYLYELYSDFKNSRSVLIISPAFSSSIVPMSMNLPLLPMYKLKNKERFIEKVKTYLIFS
jgi:hypothetical protein